MFKPVVSDTAHAQDSREMTEIHLNIEYTFANPVYSTLSAAAAPKVADKMIEAFEKRVKGVMDGPAVGSVRATEGVGSGKA